MGVGGQGLLMWRSKGVIDKTIGERDAAGDLFREAVQPAIGFKVRLVDGKQGAAFRPLRPFPNSVSNILRHHGMAHPAFCS